MRLSKLALLLMTSIAASSCQQLDVIDHVAVRPSQNLETIRVAVVFKADKLKASLQALYPIKNYGSIFTSPYVDAIPPEPAKPFELGFDLNTSIVNEQDYVHLEPTRYLPNGVPIGLDDPVVEIRSPQPISPKFDIYGYVDVLKQAWLGVAAIFNVLSDQYFPVGVSLNATFLNNAENRPGVVVTVFGPTQNSDGTLKVPGGLALFANVKQLIQGNTLRGVEEQVYYPEHVQYSQDGVKSVILP